MGKKCLVLFSNGLDSRLVVKLMQKDFEVIALYFKLPFAKDSLKEIEKFCKEQKVKLKVLNCCEGKLLREYLEILMKAKFGRGAGFNPCIDCKIFMLNKAKEFANKKNIDVIATGEVEGQRPMSQTPKAIKIISDNTNLDVLHPLEDLGIKGRNRKKQMNLAQNYDIDYPTPAGGCLLCEKKLKKRFKVLIKNNLIDKNTLKLTNIGRHFFIKGCWFVVARNEEECEVINSFKKNFIIGSKGKPSVYFSEKKGEKFAEELQKIYRTGASDNERENFEGVKL